MIKSSALLPYVSPLFPVMDPLKRKSPDISYTILQSMVHHCKYPLFTFDCDLGKKVTQNAAQYPPHWLIYVPAKFGAAESNGLGDVFKRKTLFYL